MIDLHTHTIFSDEVLIPAELARRAEHKGYEIIGMTDPDMSNIDFVIPRLVSAAEALNQVLNIKIIPGIEITHVPPALIAATISKSGELGAKVVIVHGETIAEPRGTGHQSGSHCGRRGYSCPSGSYFRGRCPGG
ncbi:MAG: histidinol phosphate phosphatase domain-containing protein [Desulfobacterales bacterium]